MTEREAIDLKGRSFFQDLWTKEDPWEFQSSGFEHDRYAALLRCVEDRRYGCVLEIGCGAGAFTRMLAPLADHVLALDIAPAAIARARDITAGTPGIDYRVQNIMDFDLRAAEPWDLVVMSETIYYLGWLYPFFDIAWLASELCRATRPGGRLLLANTQGDFGDALLHPWIIRTYHDLFVNVGYAVERENIFRGTKNGVDIEVLMSVFVRRP